MNPQSQRLAMTAAMAFFSIALTLNLTGVRLDQLKASNLNPANVRRTYYEASADAVRYYDNLRLVRVVESRVDDLRETSDSNKRDENQAPAPAIPSSEPQPQAKPSPKDPNGPSSRRDTPIARPRFVMTSALAPVALPAPEVLAGRGLDRAATDANSSGFSRRGNAESPAQLVGLNIPSRTIQIHLPKQEGGLA